MGTLSLDQIRIYPSTNRQGDAAADGTNIVTESNLVSHLRNVFNINNGSFVVTENSSDANISFYLGGYLIEANKASIISSAGSTTDIYAHCTITADSNFSSFDYMSGEDNISSNASNFITFDSNPTGGTYALHILNNSSTEGWITPVTSYQRLKGEALPRDNDVIDLAYSSTTGTLTITHSDGTNNSATIPAGNEDTFGLITNSAQIFNGSKTFNSSPKLNTNQVITSGNKNVTFPDQTDTVTLLDLSQTLTNKSLSNSNLTAGCTWNSVEIDNACTKDVTSSVTKDSTKLITSGGAYNADITGVSFSGNTLTLTRANSDLTATIPNASGGTRGLVNNAAQTFNGVKTFDNSPKLRTDTLTMNNGSTVTFPEQTGTVTLLDLSQALTNKSISNSGLSNNCTWNGSTILDACTKTFTDTDPVINGDSLITSNGAYRGDIQALDYNASTRELKLTRGNNSATLTKVLDADTTPVKDSTRLIISNAVYAHTNNTSNPHSVTKAQVGLGSVVNKGMDNIPTADSDNYVKSSGVYAHTSNKSNPHSVTKSQIGLSSVVNKGMDSTPTINSDNYVKSSGVYNADITNVSVEGNTLTLTRAAGNLTTSIPMSPYTNVSAVTISQGSYYEISPSSYRHYLIVVNSGSCNITRLDGARCIKYDNTNFTVPSGGTVHLIFDAQVELYAKANIYSRILVDGLFNVVNSSGTNVLNVGENLTPLCYTGTSSIRFNVPSTYAHSSTITIYEYSVYQ